MMNEYLLQEAAAKQREADNCTQGQAGFSGTLSGAGGGPWKHGDTMQATAPSMRERIHSQRERADIEARKSNALTELEYLLDKNPDVARILELLEQVGR